jgi:hypothetical protein
MKKKVAVHLFSRAVRLVARSAGEDGKSGRLKNDLLRYQRRLQQLSLEDPGNEFFRVLERANLKLLRYLMRGV